MKRYLILVAALSVASGAPVAAQLYRWVDSKGNVEYRDTPPPKDAKKVEERKMGSNTIQTSTPSYSTQQAAKNFPVTLWVWDCGENCTQARTHLARRGVPYTEKDPKADLAAFEKLTGGNGVPVLYVGQTKLTGYLASEWDSALDAAGYPSSTVAGAKPPAKPAAEKKAAAEPQAQAPDTGKDGTAAAPPPPQPAAERPRAGK